jgi:mRNA interferase MazF
MPSFDVWDVVRVPFPYTARPILQHRPALVVSLGIIGGPPGLAWVLMITSAENRRWPGDVEIADLGSAGLPAPSVVRTAKIATIETAEANRLGTLHRSERETVARHLADAVHVALGAERNRGRDA